MSDAAEQTNSQDQVVDEPEPSSDETGLEADAKLLVWLCRKAINTYGLQVHECDAPGAPANWGPVHPVHAKGSLHYQHRAADISGNDAKMGQYCSWVGANYRPRIAELIHNPGCSIDNGKAVPPSHWGEKTWLAHRNHVHLGI